MIIATLGVAVLLLISPGTAPLLQSPALLFPFCQRLISMQTGPQAHRSARLR
jgi:hypothetical protein